MPAPPSASKSIAAIRKVIAEVPSKKAASDYRLYGDILALFQRADEIVNDRVLLEEVLHLATEVEAFRGRGSQAAAKTFSMSLVYLIYKLKERFQVSLWDAIILAAAKASGARELLTEDLNAGQDYDGVRAVNPFAS